MKKYHVIKRDSGLNVTSNKRRKKGLDWFTQTKIGSRPLGSKCEIGDIAYIYIIDYGVVAKGEIRDIKISSFSFLEDIFSFIKKEAKYKNTTGAKSFWGNEVINKLSSRTDGKLNYYVLEVQIDLELLDEAILLDPNNSKLKGQNSWVYLNDPIEEYKIQSNELSSIIPPQLRQKIQIAFNSVSNDFVYDIDHFVPKKWGGPGNIIENLIPLNLSTNRNKSDKIPSGLFYVASSNKKISNKIESKYFKEKYHKKDSFLKELEAKDDAKRITNAVKEILSFDEIKTFYNDVRKFHFGSKIEKILD
tara:strand:+ start:287 stop:1198 length:912 start_codon:yes stop_codon:yes gene_type:complete